MNYILFYKLYLKIVIISRKDLICLSFINWWFVVSFWNIINKIKSKESCLQNVSKVIIKTKK